MSDQVALSTRIKAIKEELKSLTPIAEQPCMYKVHEQLRKGNVEAYKPVLLAIGPYNYNQGELVGGAFMKEYKLRYLQQMLERTEGSEEEYMRELKGLEGKARKCYVECTSQISQPEFVEMMLLDGCFIIELFRKYEIYKKTRDSRNVQETERFNKYISNDPIFKMEWVLPRIASDLLLFENQLPFFVLVKLFRMSESNGSRNSGEFDVDNKEEDGINVENSTSRDLSIYKMLSDLALHFFYGYLPLEWNVDASEYNSEQKIRDLVCLMDEALIPSLPKMVWKRLKVGFRFKNIEFEHLLGLIHATISISILDTEISLASERHDSFQAEIFKPLLGLMSKAKRKDTSNQEPLLGKGLEGDSEENEEAETDQAGWERESIPYSSELKEAGIKFKMAKKFKDHVNEIQAWDWEGESIPHAFELQEARIEFNEANIFKELLLDEDQNSRIYRELFSQAEVESNKAKTIKDLLDRNPDEDQNSRIYLELLSQAGVKSNKAKKFIHLLDRGEIEDVNIRSVTELEEAGVEFKKSKKGIWFYIKFKNGLMEVSPLRIEDDTETYLRNLIAYEQYCDMDESLKYVTSYVHFMDSLINSSKDVELLRQRGIIQSYLGDDGAIATMVNRLCDNINLSTYNIYSRTSRNMNIHCKRRRHKWMAKLRHDYFNSPWALISFLAAVLLLALTIVQTIFSIIP